MRIPLLIALLLANAPATAPDWVLKDSAYRTFLTRLQNAVRSDDRTAVMKLIAFPLRVNSRGSSRFYRDAHSTLRDYRKIFTPAVRRAILAQHFETLFGRDQGVMIGNGAVWFDHMCFNGACLRRGPVLIEAINR